MADKTKDTKSKFVAPPKPRVAPTSLDEKDYTYEDDKGNRRFWQGYDAKLKSQAMKVSRDPSTNGNTRRKAVKLLVEKGWSTEDREAAHLQAAQEATQRAVDRAKAKAEKAKAKAAPKPKATVKKKNTKKVEAPVEPVADETPVSDEDLAEVTPIEGPELEAPVADEVPEPVQG